jgi:hypothetical protein
VASAQLTLAVATASVLGVAGALKLAAREPLRYRAFALAEIAVATAVLVGPTRPAGFAAACLLGIGFTAYAVVHVDRPCRCFGERFRATSRSARVIRALAVVALGAAGIVAWATDRTTGVGSWPFTAGLVGAVIGGLVVALPSLVTAGEGPAEVRPSTPL